MEMEGWEDAAWYYGKNDGEIFYCFMIAFEMAKPFKNNHLRYTITRMVTIMIPVVMVYYLHDSQ